MEEIDSRIAWYEQNATNVYDDIVRIELKKINTLYDEYEDRADEMFVNEMIEAFCKIIEKQRERIAELEAEIDGDGGGIVTADRVCGHAYIPASKSISVSDAFNPQEGFRDDRQLQEAFTAYCLRDGMSSYTVNDYCSRIKNVWKSFYKEYQEGKLREEWSEMVPSIPWDAVLMNAYDTIKVLRDYIEEKMTTFEGNRNWANTRAAFKKFWEFKLQMMHME